MKKGLIVILALLGIFLLPALGYCERKDEGCKCSESSVGLAETIQSELKEIFGSEDGFAAGGNGFVNNIPENLNRVNVVSNVDLTLNKDNPIIPPPTDSTPPPEQPRRNPTRRWTKGRAHLKVVDANERGSDYLPPSDSGDDNGYIDRR